MAHLIGLFERGGSYYLRVVLPQHHHLRSHYRSGKVVLSLGKCSYRDAIKIGTQKGAEVLWGGKLSSHEERLRTFRLYIQLAQRPSAGDHHDLVCSNGDFKFNQFTAGLELWKAQAHHVEPSRFGSGYSAFGESTIPAGQRLVAVAD